ncbi:MAG: hypothetical protein R3C14_19230 [Caldilineaceae bacterium]
MSEAGTHVEKNNEPQLTTIRIKGHLADRWADWFAELTITRTETGDTLLTGSVPDQAALYGLLRKVRDLGMPLLTVHWVDPSQT